MMHIKPPENNNFATLLSYSWVVLLAIWGGAVGYFNRIDKHKIKFSYMRFLVEVSTSAFVGIITALLCDSASINWAMTAAMVGISGHMGTRALLIIENKYFGKDDAPTSTTV
jgi:hypothetical protein